MVQIDGKTLLFVFKNVFKTDYCSQVGKKYFYIVKGVINISLFKKYIIKYYTKLYRQR